MAKIEKKRSLVEMSRCALKAAGKALINNADQLIPDKGDDMGLRETDISITIKSLGDEWYYPEIEVNSHYIVPDVAYSFYYGEDGEENAED